MCVANATIRVTILEAIVLSVIPYHSSRVDFLFEQMEGTGENNQDELNSSVLPLILPAHIIVQLYSTCELNCLEILCERH